MQVLLFHLLIQLTELTSYKLLLTQAMSTKN